MTPSTRVSGRTPREIQLSRAVGLLAVAAVLHLVSGGLLASLAEEGVELLASWLGVASLLPWLAALALALDGFRGDGEKRIGRLRLAALLAAASFGLEVLAGLLSIDALEAPLPKGYRTGLNASILSACALAVASMVAAHAFARSRVAEDRRRGLAFTFVLIGVGYGFSMFSAIYYAIAFSDYAGHFGYVQGLKFQAFGGLVAACAGLWMASAFLRSARPVRPGAQPFDRERVLFRAACAFAVAFSSICLGEVLIASGAVPIGYSETAEAAHLISALAELASLVAVVCAAIGLRRAARG